MAAAPYPCPRCAAPLRFQADAGGWACDACRVVYPPQGPAQGPAPRVARARSPKTTIAIVAGAGALGLALIAMLVLALGGGKRGGKASAREVAEAAIDRATAGDLDGLVALTLVPRIADVADCGSDRALDERRAVRSGLREHLDVWKGLQVTVLSVDEDGSPDVERAGRREMGCKLDHEVAHQRLSVHVHAKVEGGSEDDEELTVRATRLGDGWYLDQLGDAPSIGVMGKLQGVKDRMCACKDRACADALEVELDEARRAAERAGHGADQLRRITELDEQIMQCREQTQYRLDNPY